ncbi:Hydantoinase/oxoprolinase-domain-containing protein [Leucosporidium creatinivorum]|uniref:Hydantoinase/oxoprolinase-domain-containing protein n=1 Tax=Leucosporidium creatinivorum TaxID=106004 RepID=A0A1Y2F3L7_9BASI|nr:Hydantoinase/oxoprolinase-domain-containing protein [Leucosporidium creatinivorum]
MPHATYAVPPHSIRISCDRGGTFSDIHASYPDSNGDRKEIVFKLLSVDLANYPDAPAEGCRRVLEAVTGESIPRGTKLPTDKIEYIRLSTTVATNALLERKGAGFAFVVTKGFKDLLRIANQSRPGIFDLNVRRPKMLYENVLEVDERVTLVGYTSDPEFASKAVKFDERGAVISGHEGEIVRGLSGEAVRILKKPDVAQVTADLQALYDSGTRGLAICLAHSYTFQDHESLIASIAEKIGFTQVSVSSVLSPQIKMVPRATSTAADAYLTPVLKLYLKGFFAGFDDKLSTGSGDGARVEFMTSEGTLVNVDKFGGLKSLLSGPAGGVVGYSLTSWDEEVKQPLIGFDMGGTSTDVSRFGGSYETVFETITAGISIQSPQLKIDTVAAGGGSCLTFRNGLFNVGPESAGAHPGPACYRKGGPLAVTDANLILGRLLPDYFPKIFGKSEKEPLDVEASRAAFESLRSEINAFLGASGGQPMSLDEVAYGFIKVANETMARPIRSLTEARGFSTAKHALASFGGAGGQHACEIARSLGISTVLIHRFSSILSAYGLALADRAHEIQEPCAATWTLDTKDYFVSRVEKLKKEVVAELKAQGFAENMIETECYLNMRYDGSDTSLMTLAPADGSFDFQAAFFEAYKYEFGFLLDLNVVVDDVRVRGIGKTFDSLGETVYSEVARLSFAPAAASKSEGTTSMYFESTGRVDVPVYLLEKLEQGDLVEGPSLLLDGTQTLILDPKSEAKIASKHVFVTLSE